MHLIAHADADKLHVRRINEDGANIKLDSGFEAGSRRYRFDWEDKEDKEERAAWRDTQKRKVGILMAEPQAEDKKRADEIKIQMAKIEAAKEQARRESDKELPLTELELEAQQGQASASLTASPPPLNKDAKPPKLPSFIDEKDKLDSYPL